MVDSIGASGQSQNTAQTSQAKKNSDSNRSDTISGTSSVSNNSDTVNISSEALDLVQAQEASKAAATQLSEDQGATLSADPQRLNALI